MASAHTPEWDPNGKRCKLCSKQFGLFSRKHHCRHCGRLVCENCSSQRLVISLESMRDKPKRVCDGCFKILTQKRIIKEEASNQKIREETLLRETSKVFFSQLSKKKKKLKNDNLWFNRYRILCFMCTSLMDRTQPFRTMRAQWPKMWLRR